MGKVEIMEKELKKVAIEKKETKVVKASSNTAAPTSKGRSAVEAAEEYGFAPVETGYLNSKSALDIDEALKKELKSLKFQCRWINYKTYRAQGFHKRQWKPFIRKSLPPDKTRFDVNADGFMVRNDLILAIKPVSYVEKHRHELREKSRFQANTQANKKKELQDFADNSGLGAKVHDVDD